MPAVRRQVSEAGRVELPAFEALNCKIRPLTSVFRLLSLKYYSLSILCFMLIKQ